MKFEDIKPGMLVEVGTLSSENNELFLVDSVIDDEEVFRVLRDFKTTSGHYAFIYIDTPSASKGSGYNEKTFEHKGVSRYNMLSIWGLPKVTELGLIEKETRTLLWSKKIPAIKMTVAEMEDKLTELMGMPVEWVCNDI